MKITSEYDCGITAEPLMTILKNGRLHENSLHEARTLIAETIQAAFEACYSTKGEWEELKLNIMHAWKLIEQFGDLFDQGRTYDDFLIVANEWIDDGTWEFPTIEQFAD